LVLTKQLVADIYRGIVRIPFKSSVILLHSDLQSKETGKRTGHRALHPLSALFTAVGIEQEQLAVGDPISGSTFPAVILILL
jgi:hypothetical protein